MIWPFKKEETVAPAFQGLRFRDTDGKLYDYKPTKTISAYDAAMLLPLAMTETILTDRFAYIREHRLEKHFKLIEE